MEYDNWSIQAISDADEPGDAVLTGIRHRDYDGVMLVAVPDEDGGWLCTDEFEVPVRPLLLFYRGEEPDADKVLAWLENHSEEGLCAVPGPVPTSHEAFEGGAEAIRSLPVSLYFPPYPWSDEAELGMEMGRLYFDSVELIDWSDPTEEHPGSHTFRFYKSYVTSNRTMSDLEIDVDDVPY